MYYTSTFIALRASWNGSLPVHHRRATSVILNLNSEDAYRRANARHEAGRSIATISYIYPRQKRTINAYELLYVLAVAVGDVGRWVAR